MIKEKSFYKTLLRLSLPAAFQSALSLLVTMADNVMVTRAGANALSAVSQSNAVTTFVTAALNGLATGAVVLISQYFGKKDEKRIRILCAVSFTVCLAFALLFVGLAEIFPGTLLSLVINRGETEVIALARQYLPIVALSFVPYALTASMVGMLKAVSVVRVTLYASFLSLITNVFFNYGLIFGHFGLPALGVPGAAIATVIARWVECGVVAVYLFKIQKVLKLRPRDFLRPERWAYGDYARFGLPVGLGDAQWALVCLLKSAVLGQLGKTVIDAVAVTDMMLNLGTIFTFALAGGACVMVGQAMGAGNLRRVREESGTIQVVFAAAGVCMSLLVFLLRRPFAALYALDAEANALAVRMIGVCAFTLLGTTYHAACFVGINRGAGDARFVMRVDLICGWLVVLPLSFLAAFVLGWSPVLVYFCTRIDQCFKWIIAFIRLRGDKWMKNVTREDKNG